MAIVRVVSFSGGLSSYLAAKRCVEWYGHSSVRLVFADTKIEDYDTYRFIKETSSKLGLELTILADGRDIWQVFKDRRFLGNSLVDPCSQELKRKILDDYILKHYTPENAVRVIGYSWDEAHRFDRFQQNIKPWTAEAPMMQKPYLMKSEMIAECKRDGINPPRLYALGFSHNNCGGGCCKAGQAHWKLVYEKLPDVYANWERKEQELREYLGKDVSMMSQIINGVRHGLTLSRFRTIIENKKEIDMFDFGACSCFSQDSDDSDD